MIKKLLPWLVGLVCLAQVAVGCIAAASIRADQRKAAAEAKDRREVAALHAALTPIALSVFDVVQPMHDVEDDPDGSADYYPQLRNDVLARTGAADAVARLQARLAQLAVPASRRAAVAALRKAMTRLVTATTQLASATHAKGDRSGYVKDFDDAFDALDAATGDWSIAVTSEFGPRRMPTPSSGRVTALGRKAPSRGGYVRLADRACGVAAVAGNELPDHQDFATFVREDLPREVAIGERMAKALSAIAPPPDAAARRLRILSGAIDRFNGHERAMIAAQRAGDPAAFVAASRALLAGLPAMRDLSHAFQKYGATVCADVLDVSDLLAGDPTKPGLST